MTLLQSVIFESYILNFGGRMHGIIPSMFEKFRKTKLQKKVRKKVRKKEHSMLHTQIFIGIVIMIVLSLLVTAIWYGTRIEALQITQVEVVGGYTIPHSEIEDLVQQTLVGEYLMLIPRTFKFMYPKKVILEKIRNIPRMKNVHIEVIDGQKITVIFEEYRPYSLWCKDLRTDICFFMDRQGFSFVEAPILSGSAFVRYVDTTKEPQEKVQAFDREFIDSTQTFAQRLAEELDLYVTYIEKIDNLDILYTVSGGGVLKVSQTMTPEKSFQNLKTILDSEDFIHLQNGNFQYIDLRFGDKIFLNEEDEQSASSSEEADRGE